MRLECPGREIFQMGDPADLQQPVATLCFELPTYVGGTASPQDGSGTAKLSEAEAAAVFAAEAIPLVNGNVLRVGRARSNDLVVEHPAVSRFHAVFSASWSGVVLSDLSSLNGTFVNGRRISTPIDLRDGDTVRIGGVRVRVMMQRESGGIEDETTMSTSPSRMAPVVITVLVADISQFSKLSRDVPPEDLTEMLSRWFTIVEESVKANDGEMDKYLGDCAMAIFRQGEGRGKANALSAVRAAKAILQATAQLADTPEWKALTEYPWQCRIALNSGEALMGAIGVGGAREITVIGDTVNVAFRLEAVADDREVPLILGESTSALVRDDFTLEPLGEVILEGRRDTVKIATLK